MSFFFKNAAKSKRPTKAASGPRGGGASPKTAQNAKTLNRLGCKVCPLSKETPKVNTEFSKKDCLIFFLGEAPGADEAKKERPFVGKSGKLLRSMIDDSFEDRVAFGNVVMNRPPSNRTPTWHEIECCRGYITADIEKARPRLIVGLGGVPLQWALGSSDIGGMRGRLFTIKVGNHVCYYYPAYHPSFILRIANDQSKPLFGKMGGCFKLDFEHLFEMVEYLPDPHLITPEDLKKDIDTYNGSEKRHYDELMDHFHACNKAKEMAIDLETYPLRPFAKDAVLITASVSYRDKNHKVRTFAFAYDSPKDKWSDRQRSEIKSQLKKLLKNKNLTKIAHNVPFELEWLLSEFGTEIVDYDNWDDTMMQAHFIDERKGPGKEEDRRPTYQSLDFLCRLYFGLELKSLFKLNKKDMRKNDQDQVLIYNGCDSKTTLMLYEKQHAKIVGDGLLDAYEFAKPRQTTVAIMQTLGMDTNQDEVKKHQNRLNKELKKIGEEIQDLKVVKRYVKDHGSFNPLASATDVLTVFRDYLKREEVKVQKKYTISGEDDFSYSVDKNVLEKIDHPLAKQITKYRNRTKLLSTNIDCFELGVGDLVYPDKKIHTNYNTTFTTTGRTSSDDPNLQNFPKREDSWVRSLVVAPEGHVIIAVDYGQLEWCMACVCSRDKEMIKATWAGYDVHMHWAEKIAAIYPKIIGGKKKIKDKKAMKKFRSKVKNKMVFPCIFGATETSVAGYLNMPQDIIDDIMDQFWDQFHELKEWQNKLMKEYYKIGYVDNLIGRRRRYPLTRNEAINFPIQSLASEFVVDSMNTLSRLAIETGEMHLHPRMNIHDDLTFVVPDDPRIVEESIETIYRAMLDLPFEYINVPLSVEVSIGYNWFDMEEIGKYWSNKDL